MGYLWSLAIFKSILDITKLKILKQLKGYVRNKKLELFRFL